MTDTPLSPLRRFLRLLQPDRREIGYIYLYAVLVGLIALVGPLGVQAIINLIAGGEYNASLVLLVVVVTSATIFLGVLKIMQYVVAETLQRRLFARASLEFAYRLPRIRLEALRKDYPPELVNRFFDTITVQKGLPKILLDFSGAVMQIIFGLVLVALYHPFFAIFGAVLAVLLTLLVWIAAPRGMRTSLQESKYKYKVAGWLEDIARASNTFKLAGGEQLSLRRTNELLGGYLGARSSHFRVLLFHYGGLVVFQALITASFLLLGGILVIENQINIGQFVAAEIIILLIVSSAEKLIFTLDIVYDTLTGVEKLASVTDLPLENGGDLLFSSVDTGRGMAVEVNDVHFIYPESGTEALNGIDLKLAPNEKVCIAGYNRSGRSTLISLLAGMRFDFEGRLTFNDVPVGNLELNSLRKNIGDYSPEESIIPGSLTDNICLGHPDVNFEDIQWALGIANLNHWVAEQPHGYSTELVAEGLNVPRSVRVRLLLARAIIRRPRLLVLGGLLEQLEPSIRKTIVQELTSPATPWTLVLVSNDPLVARACGRALVMRRGQITHDGAAELVLADPSTLEVWNNGVER
ncbi:ABC transporter transmembrane domain-containing protein [Neolewinella lacunae]|uniref:ATP-binding cassette domain-containing protein n=1 Tax=Neolewinella lacunae TaxID=1517758 RepID=A0A923PGB3_9BACT|nr:ABC transporter transmembrane domain-containing protein [Neolewinella lacunae]MBC6993555.1 ATP-binding cassette domain-containing protein [Neolewinella lacunae]MDN3636169.1 ABC transporter transmembrane domain-containing protein [Neolewinella lacunae]